MCLHHVDGNQPTSTEVTVNGTRGHTKHCSPYIALTAVNVNWYQANREMTRLWTAVRYVKDKEAANES